MQGLIVFSRLGVYVRLPGVDAERFGEAMQGSGMLGYLDALSGAGQGTRGVCMLGCSCAGCGMPGVASRFQCAWGALPAASDVAPTPSCAPVTAGGSLGRVGVFSLGIVPYINASILLQLLATAFPSLKKLQREEGPQGRARFQQYQKLAALLFAVAQAAGQLTYLRPYVEDFSAGWLAESVLLLTTGAMILVYVSCCCLSWASQLHAACLRYETWAGSMSQCGVAARKALQITDSCAAAGRSAPPATEPVLPQVCVPSNCTASPALTLAQPLPCLSCVARWLTPFRS